MKLASKLACGRRAPATRRRERGVAERAVVSRPAPSAEVLVCWAMPKGTDFVTGGSPDCRAAGAHGDPRCRRGPKGYSLAGFSGGRHRPDATRGETRPALVGARRA